MKRTLPAIAGLAAIATPAVTLVEAIRATSAAAATSTVRVVKRTVTGSEATADRWGYIKVSLQVRKTTTVSNGKTKVTRRIIRVTVPEYPNHTDRSVFINQQALPYLTQEVMQAQFNSNIQLISGATDTSYAFQRSLQAAIVKARKV
jgi:uncharacterized protein with FMN-binding domain